MQRNRYSAGVGQVAKLKNWLRLTSGCNVEVDNKCGINILHNATRREGMESYSTTFMRIIPTYNCLNQPAVRYRDGKHCWYASDYPKESRPLTNCDYSNLAPLRLCFVA